MSMAGKGAKAAFDLFTGLPPWVQTAVITGWGLNKLTGGALGSIIGQLGSGLIKGVLGMNAGVVNINAAVVNGGGGLPGGGRVPTPVAAVPEVAAGVGVAATIAGVVAALASGAVVVGAGYLLSKLVNPQGNSGNIMGGGMPLTGGGTNTAPPGFGSQIQRGSSGGGNWGTQDDAAFKAAILDNPSLSKLGEIAGLIATTNSILFKEWGSAAGKIAGITARSEAAHAGKAPTISEIDRTFTNDLLFQTKKIVADGHTTASRIADLQKLQALATAHGDTKTAAAISAALGPLKITMERNSARTEAAQRAAAAISTVSARMMAVAQAVGASEIVTAIRGIQVPTVTVITNVSARDTVFSTKKFVSYGGARKANG
jgi:hypothetical protein